MPTGVWSSLLDAEHSQEYSEAILAYFFLWRQQATTLTQIDDRCEALLRGLNIDADFEVYDAAYKLLEDRLVTYNHARGIFKPVPIVEASKRVEHLIATFHLTPLVTRQTAPTDEDDILKRFEAYQSDSEEDEGPKRHHLPRIFHRRHTNGTGDEATTGSDTDSSNRKSFWKRNRQDKHEASPVRVSQVL
eukprot:m.106616 g.106616  ORF g.106616 m.106616 type:complete len:190 (-) comp15789_c0_seq3:136-705(-)